MPYSIYTKDPPMTWLVKDVPFDVKAGWKVSMTWAADLVWNLETTSGRKLFLRSEQILVIREVTDEDVAKAKAAAEQAEKDGQGKIVRPQYGFPGGRH